MVQDFRKQKKGIGSSGLQALGILKIFQEITATKRVFICVDAHGKCLPEHRVVVLESRRQILQRSPNTRLRVFITGRL